MTTQADHATERGTITSHTGGVSNLFYFTVPAPDLERSKAFFGRVLGWEVGGGALGGHVSSVTPAGGLMPGAAPDTPMVFITVDDLDAAMAKVIELGGEVDDEVSRGEAGAWVACRDDQGTRFTLQDPTDGIHVEYAKAPVKGIRHGDLFYFSLPVADGDAGRRFYGELFGWEFGEPGSAGGMNAHNLVTEGGIGAGREGDHVELWFRVDDLAASIELIRELGGDATDAEDTAEGLISFCHDDQGVAFGLAQPAPGF